MFAYQVASLEYYKYLSKNHLNFKFQKSKRCLLTRLPVLPSALFQLPPPRLPTTTIPLWKLSNIVKNSHKKIVSKTHHHKISLKTVLCHKPCSTNSPFLNIYYWSLSISWIYIIGHFHFPEYILLVTFTVDSSQSPGQFTPSQLIQ